MRIMVERHEQNITAYLSNDGIGMVYARARPCSDRMIKAYRFPNSTWAIIKKGQIQKLVNTLEGGLECFTMTI